MPVWKWHSGIFMNIFCVHVCINKVKPGNKLENVVMKDVEHGCSGMSCFHHSLQIFKFRCHISFVRWVSTETDYMPTVVPLFYCITRDLGRESLQPGQRVLITYPTGLSSSGTVLRADGKMEQKEHCTLGKLEETTASLQMGPHWTGMGDEQETKAVFTHAPPPQTCCLALKNLPG